MGMFEIEWRKLREFPNYEISGDGEVRNTKTGNIIESYYTHIDVVRLVKNKKRYWRSLEKLLKTTFPENF